jgi:hypothetical protein
MIPSIVNYIYYFDKSIPPQSLRLRAIGMEILRLSRSKPRGYLDSSPNLRNAKSNPQGYPDPNRNLGNAQSSPQDYPGSNDKSKWLPLGSCELSATPLIMILREKV